MPTAIDQRLASIWHRDRIEMHADVERLVRALEHPFNELFRGLVGLAADQPDAWQDPAMRLVDEAFQSAAFIIRRRFAKLAQDAHARALGGFAQTVPRRWFRAIGVFQERIADEPAKPKMSAEEWEAALAEMTFQPPSQQDIEAWLDHKGPGGMAWDERLRSWEGPTRDALRSELTQGLAEGEGLSALRARLKPLTEGITYKAQRIARTEGRRIGELAQQRTVQQAGDLIGAQEIIATLDQNTRPEHALRHGKRYDRQPDGSFVADDGEVLPDLPDAPNCRCFASAVLATPEEFLTDPALGADFANATADTIPDPSAYSQWFLAAEEPVRIAAVGVRRYRAAQSVLDGAPEWIDFIGPDGRLLSPQAIKGESVAARQARRAAVEEIIRRREAMIARAAA